MPLPIDFQFSQSSLQDFHDCPRRFELRYILHLQWPAIQSEPVLEQEHRLLLGTQFHKMIHQAILGLPYEKIQQQATDDDLFRWWQQWVQSSLLANLAGSILPEFTLTAPFSNFRLVAKYDLLVMDTGKKFTIFDWKTSSKRPSRFFLKNRLQTRVYMFLLTDYGCSFNQNMPVKPEQVNMVYWFPEYPDEPEIFDYSLEQLISDEEFLRKTIEDIHNTPAGSFFLTLDEKKCSFCIFRSLCNRGTRAGNPIETEDESDFLTPDTNLDFGQIGETDY